MANVHDFSFALGGLTAEEVARIEGLPAAQIDAIRFSAHVPGNFARCKAPAKPCPLYRRLRVGSQFKKAQRILFALGISKADAIAVLLHIAAVTNAAAKRIREL